MNQDITLTKRQEEVAGLKAWGASDKEIASKLFISKRTVENHVRGIHEKVRDQKIGLAAWFFCKYHGVNPLVNPLLSILFLLMVSVNEISGQDLRPVNGRVTVVTKTGKRRHDDTL